MAQNRLLTLLSHLLTECWKFMRLPFPGTNVPIGAILFLPMVVSFAMSLFRSLTGQGGFGLISGSVRSGRSASGRNPDREK